MSDIVVDLRFAFALKEYELLKQEIASLNEELDKIIRRSVPAVFIAYFFLLSGYLPFSEHLLGDLLPRYAKILLALGVPGFVGISWYWYANLVRHIDRLGDYIANKIELLVPPQNINGHEIHGWENFLNCKDSSLNDNYIVAHKRFVILFWGTLLGVSLFTSFNIIIRL